jgi:nucleotide-binding universal stress UspA family protein
LIDSVRALWTTRTIFSEADNMQAADAGVECESVVVDGGVSPVCDTIVEQAASRHCDLIAMGTHGRRGLRRLTLGSDAELVVRHAGVPVLLAKPPITKS